MHAMKGMLPRFLKDRVWFLVVAKHFCVIPYCTKLFKMLQRDKKWVKIAIVPI